jgi:hypothetical protein
VLPNDVVRGLTASSFEAFFLLQDVMQILNRKAERHERPPGARIAIWSVPFAQVLPLEEKFH